MATSENSLEKCITEISNNTSLVFCVLSALVRKSIRNLEYGDDSEFQTKFMAPDDQLRHIKDYVLTGKRSESIYIEMNQEEIEKCKSTVTQKKVFGEVDGKFNRSVLDKISEQLIILASEMYTGYCDPSKESNTFNMEYYNSKVTKTLAIDIMALSEIARKCLHTNADKYRNIAIINDELLQPIKTNIVMHITGANKRKNTSPSIPGWVNQLVDSYFEFLLYSGLKMGAWIHADYSKINFHLFLRTIREMLFEYGEHPSGKKIAMFFDNIGEIVKSAPVKKTSDATTKPKTIKRSGVSSKKKVIDGMEDKISINIKNDGSSILGIPVTEITEE